MKIVLLGAGNRARKYLEYIIANPDRVELVGVVEPNRLRRESIARKCGLTSDKLYVSADQFFALGRVADAIVIATPDKYHYPQAMAAIELGYHILLEKPIACKFGSLWQYCFYQSLGTCGYRPCRARLRSWHLEQD